MSLNKRIKGVIRQYIPTQISYYFNLILGYFCYIISFILQRSPEQISIKNNNVLFTTVCNDKYAPGLIVLLKSILTYNPSFNYKFKVYFCNNLSPVNQEKIKNIYSNIVFENHDNSLFCSVKEWFMSVLCFKEYEYDRVIFIDADMICLGNLNELIFSQVNGIGACMDNNTLIMNNISINMPKIFEINTGIMVLDREYRNPNFFNKIIKEIKKNKQAKLGDQTVLNKLLFLKQITYLPTKYNCKRNIFYTINFNYYKNPKIIHFTGANKPFLETKEHMLSTKICNNLIEKYFEFINY